MTLYDSSIAIEKLGPLPHDIRMLAPLLRDELAISDLLLHENLDRTTVIHRGRKYLPDWKKAGGFPVHEIIQHLFGLAKNNQTKNRELDEHKSCSLRVPLNDGSIARIHLYLEANSVHAAEMRIQPTTPPQLSALFGATLGSERTNIIIDNLYHMISQPQGLVLFTGPVRSGKTNLMHALLEDINEPPSPLRSPILPQHRSTMYLASDPQEFIHEDRYAFFIQREVGEATTSYEAFLRDGLRIRHDILGIEEMRGETHVSEGILRVAINGSLVMATTHTRSIIYAADRFATTATTYGLEAARGLFNEAINGIVNLRLIPGVEEEVLAVEYVNFAKKPPLRQSLATPKQLLASLDTNEGASRSLEKDLEWLIDEKYITAKEAHRAFPSDRIATRLGTF
ncbi:MAG: ATPase, T2SS/T4P/T4SS family [Vulcanimicrobiaceae bacterium]